MNFETIKKSGSLIRFCLLGSLCVGLVTGAGFEEKSVIPWKFGGYQGLDEFYLKYWSVSGDTLSDIENVGEGKLESEISELWFSKNPPRFRIDKYVESTWMRCDKLKGREWEKITDEGKTYILKERIIQIGTKRVSYDLSKISSGGGEELCEYKRFESTKGESASLEVALYQLTFIPYIADPESEELVVSGIEMDEVFDPEKYKETLNNLRKTYDKAGRKTAKWDTGHGIIKFSATGYAFIDLEWGIGLEGYVTGGKGYYETKPVTLEKPVCIYKTLSVGIEISDPNVFKKWLD